MVFLNFDYEENRMKQSEKSKQSIWLSFDLGIKGDYEGMYQWLDKLDAKECGDGFAFFEYHYQNDLIEELKADLKSAIEITKKTRIYIVYRDATNKSIDKPTGKFIIGNRKSSPWTGYAGEDSNALDE
jgi:hypothetical protein